MRLQSRRRGSCWLPLTAIGVAVAWALSAAQAQAAEPVVDTELVPVIVVIGKRSHLDTIPGSGMILEQSVLEESHVFSINEAMRKVPGVFARDEEGIGLRPNLGIRGLNPNRSSKLLMLEDGIPLAYAPYGDNASYYHPPVNRFERIEVLKGSSQIMFGPQTLGGLVNYITPDVPAELEATLGLTGGSEDYLELRGAVGDTIGSTGYMLSGTWKESDGTRANMRFEVGDLFMKVVQRLTDRQALTLRGSYYDEDSQVTYSGLTLAEWQDDPRGNDFKNDHMYATHWATSATHQFDFSDGARLLTSAYYTQFDRDWWRQSSNSNQRPNDASDPACGGLANLDTRCGNEGRLRQYWTAGVEPRFNVSHELFGVENVTDVGVRYHQEHQDRVQANGDTPDARKAGTGPNAGIKEDSTREVTAWSGFLQNRFDLGRWTVTPGLRYEHVDYLRIDNLLDTRGTATVDEWIPGIGATYEAAPGTTVFAGVHRGFSPPGVADIITPAGGTVNLDPEYSWNYELGVRSDVRNGLYVEGTLFRLDFENQIVPASVAGGTGAGLTSAGQTLQDGLELAGNIESNGFVDWPVEVFGRLSWTWLWTAKYVGDRYSSVPGSTDEKVTGNRLPYTPEQLLTGTVGVRSAIGLTVELEGVHTSSAYTDDLNTVEITPNGQRGEMPGYTVWNLSANYPLEAWDCNLFLTVKNLTDELYVVDMSRGLVPGMPRLVQGGFELKF
jgi:Fe(3+) dicitrate transport protein